MKKILILFSLVGSICFAQGVSEAQYNLGVLYYQQKNYGLAKKYFKLASDQGHSKAQKALSELYK